MGRGGPIPLEIDEENGSSSSSELGSESRIGTLPPRRNSKILKWCIVIVAVVLIAVAGYQYGGIYLMESDESSSPLVGGNDETMNEGIVTDQFDNAKAQEAFEKAQAAAGAGGSGSGGGGGGSAARNKWRDHFKNSTNNNGINGPFSGHNHGNNNAIGQENHGGAAGGNGGGHKNHNENSGNGQGGQGSGENNTENQDNNHSEGTEDESGGNQQDNNNAPDESPDQNEPDEDDESNNNNNNNNVAVDSTIALCEDYSQYDEWHNITVTKEDGPKFKVLTQFDHDHLAFTQGLTFANDLLYESTGLYGESTVRILDPETAEVKKSVSMAPEFFGEGMAYVNGTLYQITWKSRHGFMYDAETLETTNEFFFTSTRNEGWGITWDACNNEFIVTDGSEYLHFWNPEDMTEKRKIPVYRMNGKPATNMNEIEFWRGRVLANVWFEDVLLVINPETGVVEKEYDFSSLWPHFERKRQGADVFNGISISKDPHVLYVTGKKWNRMYKVILQV